MISENERKNQLSIRGIASIVSGEIERKGLDNRLFLVIHPNKKEARGGYTDELAIHSAKGCLGRITLFPGDEAKMQVNYSIKGLNEEIYKSISRKMHYRIEVEDLLEKPR